MNRTDRILEIIDVGLQTAGDVACARGGDLCVRCDSRPPVEGSGWCTACKPRPTDPALDDLTAQAEIRARAIERILIVHRAGRRRARAGGGRRPASPCGGVYNPAPLVAVFHGGPLDGQRRALEKADEVIPYLVPILEPIWTAEECSPRDSLRFRTGRYRRIDRLPAGKPAIYWWQGES